MRFVVWAGVDHDLSVEGGRMQTVLKTYLHLVSQTTGVFEEALTHAGLPISESARAAFALLRWHGFAQEIGFGIGPGDIIGVKVYFELGGWRRTVAEDVLRIIGFSESANVLCPSVPGLLEESLARRTRSGIALRLHPSSGEVAEVTTAIQLIQGMLPPRLIADRINAWIEAQDGDPSAHRRLFEALTCPEDAEDRLEGTRHTLLTRSLSDSGRSWSTVYLRMGSRALAPVPGEFRNSARF